MTELEHLQEMRKIKWQALKRTCEQLRRARKLHASIEKRHAKELSEWEKVDRELAMLDGRFHREEDVEKAKKDVLDALNDSDLAKVCEQLGIDPEAVGLHVER